LHAGGVKKSGAVLALGTPPPLSSSRADGHRSASPSAQAQPQQQPAASGSGRGEGKGESSAVVHGSLPPSPLRRAPRVP